MAFKVFHLPVPNSAKQEAALNRFLANNRVLGRRVFATRNGDDSYLSILLELPEETRLPQNGTAPNIDTTVKNKETKLGRPDRPMTKEEVEIFMALKECRNYLASSLMTHFFKIATNEDLEAIAMLRPKDMAALEHIKGMGTKRVEKYGRHFLKVLEKFPQSGKEETASSKEKSDNNSLVNNLLGNMLPSSKQ